MTIKGIISTIIFKNDDNGYAIISVKVKKQFLTLVGEMFMIDEGYFITADVTEVENKTYGTQYRVNNYEIALPDEEDAIIKILCSSDFKGIGEAVATRLVENFGTDIFNVIKNDPDSLYGIKGVTEKRLNILKQVVNEKELELENMAYLKKYQLNIKQIKNIIKIYKNKCVDIIENNPYELALKVNGISFPTCEKIALLNKLDINTDDRNFALIIYLLKEAYAKGNVFLYLNELEDMVIEYNVIDELTDILYKMQQNNMVKVLAQNDDKETKVYLFENYYIENSLSQILYKFRNNIKIITGGPGTGKTYNINKIIEENENKGLNIILCAPTGRAAKRMIEVTNHNARTIHRTLELTKIVYDNNETKYNFIKNENDKLDCDILIVDEMSMVDEYIMFHLMKAVPDTAKIILVGDVDQLPSVGAGNVLSDMIKSDLFEVVKLNKIYRQVENSNIVINAHKVNKGELIDLNKKTDDFIFVHRSSDEKVKNDISVLVSNNIPKHYNIGMDKIQVLTTTRKGECGVSSLNNVLQEKINPYDKNKKQIKYMDKIFREQDKVMQIVNNYDLIYECYDEEGIKRDEGFGVFNGDIGIITNIDEMNSIITVLFDDKYVEYEKDDFNNLDLAYAITVHKSQGSEYDIVVMSMTNASKFLINRKILYTAITRAKKCICFIGMEDIFNRMVENKYEDKRNSALCDKFYFS